MKLTTKSFFLAALVVLFTATPMLMGSQQENFKEYNISRLQQTIAEKGYVRVMVRLEVPNLEALSFMSSQYKTGNTDINLKQHAFNADLELADAIGRVRSNVLLELNGSQFQVNRIYNVFPYVALSVTNEALERLSRLPEIFSISEDKAYPLPETFNEGDTSSPNLIESTEIIGATRAWEEGYDGSGWYVAVLDTGIRRSHEMFANKSVVEQCFADGPDWIESDAGHCPNGKNAMSGPGSAAHWGPNYGHGTHVAGVAAGNNGGNRFGVARGAGIIAVNVFSFFSSENDVLSYVSDQVKGLEWVYSMRNDYNIASVNMSLGGSQGYSNYCPQNERAEMFAMLNAAGIAPVVSSGNEYRCGSINDPGCVPGAVPVTSSSKGDIASSFGNWEDNMVKVVAPGEQIVSAYSRSDEDYASISGTSFSAPHVAGAWAIFKQYDANLSVNDILEAINAGGTYLDNPNCLNVQPKPRINVDRTLFNLFPIRPPINLSAEQKTNQSFLQREYVNVITWQANPDNADQNIVNYRIYKVSGTSLTQLAELDASTFTYWHRSQNKRERTVYAATSVNDQGVESAPTYFTLEFGSEG